MLRHNNAMDSFFERNGILRNWLAHELGISQPTLYGNFREYGFSEELAQKIENLLHKKGRELLKFRFSGNHANDVEHLRSNFGIKKDYLAAQMNMSDVSVLNSATNRDNGLTKEEQEILLLAIREIAGVFLTFQFPNSLKRKAA